MTRLILTWYFCGNICFKKQAKHLLLFMLALRLTKYVHILDKTSESCEIYII